MVWVTNVPNSQCVKGWAPDSSATGTLSDTVDTVRLVDTVRDGVQLEEVRSYPRQDLVTWSHAPEGIQ